MASITSNAFPTENPNGSSISEMTAAVFLPAPCPMRTISFASFRAASSVFINAPLPTFTSSTIVSAPAAIFLLMILLAINGRLSTVSVTSLNAYSFLSAGAKFPVWPVIAMPIVLTFCINFSSESAVLNPGKLSSLSIVPPVCPSPLPLIFAILTPSTAAIGASTRVVLSPTPPVLCLSAVTPWMADSERQSPLSAIASVSASVSASFMPWK